MSDSTGGRASRFSDSLSHFIFAFSSDNSRCEVERRNSGILVAPIF